MQNTPFEKVDAWIDDWLLAKDGQSSKEPWNPTDPLVNGAYSVSKALLNAYLRNYALQPNAFPLALVCPGYCATDLNNNSGYRPASKAERASSGRSSTTSKAESYTKMESRSRSALLCHLNLSCDRISQLVSHPRYLNHTMLVARCGMTSH